MTYEYINFEKLDPRIKHGFDWEEIYAHTIGILVILSRKGQVHIPDIMSIEDMASSVMGYVYRELMEDTDGKFLKILNTKTMYNNWVKWRALDISRQTPEHYRHTSSNTEFKYMVQTYSDFIASVGSRWDDVEEDKLDPNYIGIDETKGMSPEDILSRKYKVEALQYNVLRNLPEEIPVPHQFYIYEFIRNGCNRKAAFIAMQNNYPSNKYKYRGSRWSVKNYGNFFSTSIKNVLCELFDVKTFRNIMDY